MKLSGSLVARYVRNPDPHHRGALIYGDDPALVADRRDILCKSVLGDESPELRLTRLDPATVRSDPASLFDALREAAFFGGRRVVLINGATDGMAKSLASALEATTEEDAFLIVTAGSLPARSKLRAVFEAPSTVASAPCYADSAQREDVSEALLEFCLQPGDADASAALRAIRSELDYGAYRKFLEKLATFKQGDEAPVSAQDIQNCAPLPDDPEAHAIASAILGGAVDRVARDLARTKSDAARNSSLLIALSWQSKRLYGALSVIESGSPRDKALGSLRPPVFGEARAQLSRQIDRWSCASLEEALRLVHEAQLSSRAANSVQPAAATERTLLRIAMMAARR